MLVLRRIVFTILLVVYVTVCPAMILYALGYWFRPGMEHGLVKTGLIVLSTVPSGATVYVGNSRYLDPTPTLLRELVPGTYPIRLTLPHHDVWMHHVPVVAEQATILEHVLLLPDHLPREQRSLDAFDDLVPLPGRSLVLLAQGPRLDRWMVYDWNTQQGWPLLAGDSPFRDARWVSSVIVSNAPACLLRVMLGRDKKWLWVEPRKESRVEDLTPWIGERPAWIDWDPREPRQLFAFQDGSLTRIDLNEQTRDPMRRKGIRGFGVLDKTLYVLDEDGRLTRMTFEGKHPETLADAWHSGHAVFLGEHRAVHIKLLAKDLPVFWEEGGGVVVNQFPYRVVEGIVRGVEVDPAHPRALIWQRDRVGLLEYSRPADERAPSDADLQFTWVFQGGEHIQQVWWLQEGAYALLRDGTRIVLLELGAYGNRQARELLRVKPNSAVAYAEESGLLYYLDPATKQLFSLEIIPRAASLRRSVGEPLEPRVSVEGRGR